MTANVRSIIDLILLTEGGVADVGDGKGITRFGQTPGWLEDNGFVPPNSSADAAVNYELWMSKLKLDQVAEWDVAVGHIVTDWAVHAGPVTAIKGFQSALGAVADGSIGGNTLALMRMANPAVTAKRVVAAQIRHGGRVIERHRENAKFAAGWANRWADLVESLP